MNQHQPLAPCLAVLGTGSDVGKSFLTAALCRHFAEQGLRVAPFKAQNMSNNSFVTQEGLEMGRAQAVQAQACGIEPTVAMNPVLLKPQADNQSQLVLMGIAQQSYQAQAYFGRHEELFALCLEQLHGLRQDYDLIIIEGAGSAVELNLWERDLANLKLAQAVGAQILLVGDISRGGIFAQLIGSVQLFPDWAKQQLAGMVVNRFLGDMSLFEEGRALLEQHTGKPLLGVLPEIRGLSIEVEDGYHASPSPGLPPGPPRVAWIHFPRLSNSTDLLPLEQDGNFTLTEIRSGRSLAGFDLIILPGSKAVLSDLAWLRSQGLDQEILAAAQRGAWILGICGGYQMLGQAITDPLGLEGELRQGQGLGLLPHATELKPHKKLAQVQACLGEIQLQGYEIHHGQSWNETGWLTLTTDSGQACHRPEGSRQGNVLGSYLHGLLDQAPLRHWLLTQALPGYHPNLDRFGDLASERERAFAQMAAHLRQHCDLSILTQRLLGESCSA